MAGNEAGWSKSRHSAWDERKRERFWRAIESDESIREAARRAGVSLGSARREFQRVKDGFGHQGE